jgi:hypothetical protein
MNLNESTIEHHGIALFQELGYAYAHGPDIGPDGESKEREDYGEPLLLGRLRSAIHAPNFLQQPPSCRPLLHSSPAPAQPNAASRRLSAAIIYI